MIWWKPLCSVIRYGGPFHWHGESPVRRQMICNVLNALLPFASSGSFTMFCNLQFGNLPYGFGGNTWVLPPIAVEAWGSAPHWSSCRRAPRRWSKCFELEQVHPRSLSHTYIGPWSQNPHDTNGSKQFPVMSIIESSSFLIIWLLCSASAPSYTGCQVELSTQRSYRMQVPWWITCWKRALHLCNKRVRAVAVTACSGSLALVECNNCRLRQQLRRTQLKLKQRKGLMVLQLGVEKPLKLLIGAWSQYETGYFQGRRWEHIHTPLYCLFQSAVCHFGFGFLAEFVKALLCALLTSSLTACW
jgi:hypothetical protein